ncbi:MAG: hypothetical protein JWP97_3845 [Labilithrix sp.]|nr:hypothetical protein [Labilithrix sp.]
MCRNIRVLHHFRPPTTADEVHAAALQYVRKVSGTTPGKTPNAAFEEAVAEVAAATAKLLATLPARGEPRTREGEREKARLKWGQRVTRITKASS